MGMKMINEVDRGLRRVKFSTRIREVYIIAMIQPQRTSSPRVLESGEVPCHSSVTMIKACSECAMKVSFRETGRNPASKVHITGRDVDINGVTRESIGSLVQDPLDGTTCGVFASLPRELKGRKTNHRHLRFKWGRVSANVKGDQLLPEFLLASGCEPNISARQLTNKASRARDRARNARCGGMESIMAIEGDCLLLFRFFRLFFSVRLSLIYRAMRVRKSFSPSCP